MSPETREKISELQNLEQNINNILAQKQQFQAQHIEIENALSHVEETEEVFQVIGNVMVKSPKEKVLKNLGERKEIAELRLQTLDKQEKKLRTKAEELQKAVMEEM